MRLDRIALGAIVRSLVRVNGDGTVSLTNVVQVSGLGGQTRAGDTYRGGTFEYYVSEPMVADDDKDVGRFILAALELGK